MPAIRGFEKYKKKKKQNLQNRKFYWCNFYGKKKFLKLKMFDENFFYWEDIDLSSRILKSKYNIFINHDPKAIHTWSSTKLNISSMFIKNSNFKYGEYLYQYKNNKLKTVKILRQPFAYLFLCLLNLMVLNPKKSLENLFNIYGIMKFIILILVLKKLRF